MAENTAIPIIASNKSKGASQGMYKNRVKDDKKFFLKFPLFYLAIEEIQSGKIQNIF